MLSLSKHEIFLILTLRQAQGEDFE